MGNFNIITLDHVKKLKNNAFVGNTGHFDDEIGLADSEGLEGMKVDNIKPQKISRLSHVFRILGHAPCDSGYMYLRQSTQEFGKSLILEVKVDSGP